MISLKDVNLLLLTFKGLTVVFVEQIWYNFYSGSKTERYSTDTQCSTLSSLRLFFTHILFPSVSFTLKHTHTPLNCCNKCYKCRFMFAIELWNPWKRLISLASCLETALQRESTSLKTSEAFRTCWSQFSCFCKKKCVHIHKWSKFYCFYGVYFLSSICSLFVVT